MVKVKATIVSDRSPESAEKKTGSDFILTADITDNKTRIQKVVVGQAELGFIESMSPSMWSEGF